MSINSRLYGLTGVTGSAFSKIEYDREMTNELNELAIRKGLPKIQSVEQKHKIDVPSDINDDYSYLYICRMNADSVIIDSANETSEQIKL